MSDLDLDQFYFQDSFLKEHLKDYNFDGLTQGKYLRSRLLELFGDLYDLPKDKCKCLGRIVELVHNATLTHDDVIDHSHTRRGSPSVPSLINNKKSVLLGDYMLAKALHELSEFKNTNLSAELTLTLKDLVEGEWIQYENTNPYEISKNLYTRLAIKKTGSLFRWALIAPHLAAGKNQDSTYELLVELGESLGVIFQITDDLIDFNKESKKTYGLDFKNNNINYVLHYIGTSNPEVKTKFLRADTINDLEKSDFELIDKSILRSKNDVKQYVDRSKEILEDLKGKYTQNKHTSLLEFCSILDLVIDRVF